MKPNFKKFLFILLPVAIVGIFYLPTLTRDWQMFDEWGLFHEENLYPFPQNLKEFFEIVFAFGLKSNLESQNSTFSKIINIRSGPISSVLISIIGALFNKQVIYFHLVPIILHMINTIFVWLIFYEITNHKKNISQENLVFPTLLSIIWGIHPTNIEAVMMSTNFTSVLLGTLAFYFILYSMKQALSNLINISKTRFALISALFFTGMLVGEYNYTLPFIIFFLAFSVLVNNTGSITDSLKKSLKLSLPYLTGLIIFIPFYFGKLPITNIHNNYSINFHFERILFITPQIFTHFLKLIFFPKALSIFQSNLVYFGKSLTDTNTLVSLLLLILLMIFPIVLFLILKNNKLTSPFFILYAFFFALFPFLHIIAPTYCLISERYCYLPLFILLFFTAQLLNVFNFNSRKSILYFLLILIIIPLSGRTFFRLPDWHNSFTLYNSMLKTTSKPIYKGFYSATIGYYFNTMGRKEKAQKYFHESIKYLESALEDFKSIKESKSELEVFQIYGLDRKTLALNAAFRIASIRLFVYREKPAEVLSFYENYIKNNLDFLGSSQIDLYVKLLVKTGRTKKALKILTYARGKYPFSPSIMFSLVNLYFKQNKTEEAEKLLSEAEYLYPTYIKTISFLIKLAERKGDKETQAKYEYLLGLRNHSEIPLQKAVQLYLETNKFQEAEKILRKLLSKDSSDPINLWLLGKYYILTNNNKDALKTLERAYELAKILNIRGEIDSTIYESILLSLISINLSYNNTKIALEYTNELGKLPSLSSSAKRNLNELRKKLGSM